MKRDYYKYSVCCPCCFNEYFFPLAKQAEQRRRAFEKRMKQASKRKGSK